jgi:hypothetical protein
MKISLLLATRGRDELPWHCFRALWIPRCTGQHLIEFIFAFDHDDVERAERMRARLAADRLPGWLVAWVIVCPPAQPGHPGTNYNAWNQAWAACTGDVGIQLSDDFEPMPEWDRLLAELLPDPRRPCVVGIGDPPGPPTQPGFQGTYCGTGLNTIQVITRAYVEQRGYFLYPEYLTYGDYDATFAPMLDMALVDGYHHLYFWQNWVGGSGDSACRDATFSRQHLADWLGNTPKAGWDGAVFTDRLLAGLPHIRRADATRPLVPADERLAPGWTSAARIEAAWQQRKLHGWSELQHAVPEPGSWRDHYYAGRSIEATAALRQIADLHLGHCKGRCDPWGVLQIADVCAQLKG